MVELLSTYSGTQIILFLFIVAIAIKETIDLVEYFKGKIRKRVVGVVSEESSLEELSKSIKNLQQSLENTNQKVDILVASDRDDIKSWIVHEWRRFLVHPEELDEFEMDCLEKRYSHYKEEGGNTYIDTIMDDLRAIYKNRKGG